MRIGVIVRGTHSLRPKGDVLEGHTHQVFGAAAGE